MPVSRTLMLQTSCCCCCCCCMAYTPAHSRGHLSSTLSAHSAAVAAQLLAYCMISMCPSLRTRCFSSAFTPHACHPIYFCVSRMPTTNNASIKMIISLTVAYSHSLLRYAVRIIRQLSPKISVIIIIIITHTYI